MTSDEFRKMALEIPTAIEQSHMNHPDFRVAGKIFASLGVPSFRWGHQVTQKSFRQHGNRDGSYATVQWQLEFPAPSFESRRWSFRPVPTPIGFSVSNHFAAYRAAVHAREILLH